MSNSSREEKTAVQALLHSCDCITGNNEENMDRIVAALESILGTSLDVYYHRFICTCFERLDNVKLSATDGVVRKINHAQSLISDFMVKHLDDTVNNLNSLK